MQHETNYTLIYLHVSIYYYPSILEQPISHHIITCDYYIVYAKLFDTLSQQYILNPYVTLNITTHLSNLFNGQYKLKHICLSNSLDPSSPLAYGSLITEKLEQIRMIKHFCQKTTEK